jgi:diguanylate cyclase (GGDEF)-like protein
LESRLAKTVAKSLANNPFVIQGYLQNNRSLIINEAKNVWSELGEEKTIYEMHFFKPDAISFVNFHNLDDSEHNVSFARMDVVQTYQQTKNSEHFWVCRLYPGIRSTFPIVDNQGNTLGVISIGIHLSNFSTVLHNTFQLSGALFYDSTLLKQQLKPNLYQKFIADKTIQNRWVIDKTYINPKLFPLLQQIDVQTSHQRLTLHHTPYSILSYPIIDLNDNIIGYYVVVENLNEVLNYFSTFYDHFYTTFFVLTLIILALIFMLYIREHERLKRIIDATNAIKDHHFTTSLLTQERFENDEIGTLERNIQDMGIAIRNSIDDLTTQVSFLEHKSYHDALTGIYNRQAFNDIATHKMHLFQQSHESLAVVILDIDHFKQINDHHGHDIGDEVLKFVTSTIVTLIRKGDYLFRLGGEEFVLLLPNSDHNSAIAIAQKIRQHFETCGFSTDIYITVSLGVTQIQPDDMTIDQPLKRADEKLYEAKNSGRNRVCS